MARKQTSRGHNYADQLRRDRESKQGTRTCNKRFLIVFEDAKSAANYFKELRKYLRVHSADIEIAPGNSRTQPQQIVDRANNLMNQATPENRYDEVWVVFDGDFGATKIANARTSANTNSINLAISTPFFEYWLILHYEEYCKTQCTKDQMLDKLKEHWRNYDKGAKQSSFQEIVRDYMTAAKRARKIRDRKVYDNPEDQNPCSELYLLTNALDKAVSRPK